ncbi:MAG TPA: hypothetical protein VNB22_15975 [Pyrinomonadaceae bacterium]|nr:hypothetical protein [Pyrinomonadaceae bacterium]
MGGLGFAFADGGALVWRFGGVFASRTIVFASMQMSIARHQKTFVLYKKAKITMSKSIYPIQNAETAGVNSEKGRSCLNNF